MKKRTKSFLSPQLLQSGSCFVKHRGHVLRQLPAVQSTEKTYFPGKLLWFYTVELGYIGLDYISDNRIYRMKFSVPICSRSQGVGRWAPAATRFMAYASNFPFFPYYETTEIHSYISNFGYILCGPQRSDKTELYCIYSLIGRHTRTACSPAQMSNWNDRSDSLWPGSRCELVWEMEVFIGSNDYRQTLYMWVYIIMMWGIWPSCIAGMYSRVHSLFLAMSASTVFIQSMLGLQC